MNDVIQYKLSLEQVLKANSYCVVIDKTGNPGQDSGSLYLDSSRKTWVAVILSAVDFDTVARELPLALEGLEQCSGGREFHLTDIYRGHKDFKEVAPELRLKIISFLAYIFSKYQFPILVQTLDKIEAKKFRNHSENFNQKIGAFDLRKHEDLALWMLLIMVQKQLANPQAKGAYVVLDEGRWKDERAIDISRTVSDPSTFANKQIYSLNSTKFPAIQLADFVAFCLNRQQWLMSSKSLTDFDKEFLRIIGTSNLNFINIPKLNIDMNLCQPSDYDFIRGVIDEDKGILSR